MVMLIVVFEDGRGKWAEFAYKPASMNGCAAMIGYGVENN